jgi:hypothetical protein
MLDAIPNTPNKMNKITSSHLINYANKKGITQKQARTIFDRVYTPTINGWKIRTPERVGEGIPKRAGI